MKYSAATKTARLTAVASAIGGTCVINLYDSFGAGGNIATSGTPDTAVTTQNLLVACAGNATFTATDTGGVLTAAPITGGTGTAVCTLVGLTATWGRISTSGGTAILDFTIGISGTDMICTPDALIKTGTPFSIPTLTITSGN